MSKFNRPVPPRVPNTRTSEGGEGFTKSPKEALFTLGLMNMVGEDTFYESGPARDKRFKDLIHEVTKTDPDWVRSFLGWLRSEGLMRSAPLVGAIEYVRAGGPNARQTIASVLQRPDEPAEMIGYWLNTYGRNLPMPVKRGIADALPRLYNERNVLRYDGSGKAIRFGDVVEMVHPRPQDTHQNVLYKHLIDRRHGRDVTAATVAAVGLPMLSQDISLLSLPAEARRANLDSALNIGWDWKRIAGWVPGGMDAAAWEAAIPNMGLMALTRNLRNFDKVGLSDRVVHEITGRFLDPEEVRKSRQFPLRFLTAWKAISSIRWGHALEAAINHSMANVPVLDGRTLILVDVSPSMRDVVLSRRTDGKADMTIMPRRWEAAAVFAGALAQRAQSADVVLFDFNPVAHAKMHPGDSVLRFAEQCGEWANKSSGTDILGSLAKTWDNHKRVIILTDEQHGYAAQRRLAQTHRYYSPIDQHEHSYTMGSWEDVAHIKVPVFTFNLGGYSTGVTPNEGNWHTFGGLSDACFGLIPMLERRRAGSWPWEVITPPAEVPISPLDPGQFRHA